MRTRERKLAAVAFMSCFYEAVLLDLGTGVGGPLARFAIERADQVVLVTTPEWVMSSVVLDALAHVEHTTIALNKSLLRAAVEQRFRAERLHRAVTIPYDEQLAAMLDAGHYTLDAQRRPEARLAVAQRSLTGMEARLGVARGRVQQVETAGKGTRQLARSNRQLRRELRTERVRRQARRQR